MALGFPGFGEVSRVWVSLHAAPGLGGGDGGAMRVEEFPERHRVVCLDREAGVGVFVLRLHPRGAHVGDTDIGAA